MNPDKLILCVAKDNKAYPVVLSKDQEEMLLLICRGLGELKIIPNNYFEYDGMTVGDLKKKIKG